MRTFKTLLSLQNLSTNELNTFKKTRAPDRRSKMSTQLGTNLFKTNVKNIPKIQLQVEEETQKKLGEIFAKEKYEVHRFEEEAGFCIVKMSKKPDDDNDATADAESVQEDLPLAVNVTLTSNQVREEFESRKENKKEEELEVKERSSLKSVAYSPKTRQLQPASFPEYVFFCFFHVFCCDLFHTCATGVG